MMNFQSPSLLIGKVWVPMMHFCVSHTLKSALDSGQELASCRLISEQPLIGLTIREFSIGSAMWVLELLLALLTQFLSNRSQQVMVDGCRSRLVDVV